MTDTVQFVDRKFQPSPTALPLQDIRAVARIFGWAARRSQTTLFITANDEDGTKHKLPLRLERVEEEYCALIFYQFHEGTDTGYECWMPYLFTEEGIDVQDPYVNDMAMNLLIQFEIPVFVVQPDFEPVIFIGDLLEGTPDMKNILVVPKTAAVFYLTAALDFHVSTCERLANALLKMLKVETTD